MDIWNGSISLPPNTAPFDSLEDVHLSTPSTSPPVASSLVSHLKYHLFNSTLSFLSYVDPNLIPLFLATGPSLTVTTTSPSTERFFNAFFHSALPKSAVDYSCGNPEQSQIALLLRVNPDPERGVAEDDNDWGITELCFYGSITHPTLPADALALTPPNSSPDCETPPPQAVVTVYALPLSSRHAFPQHLPQAKLESVESPTEVGRPTTPSTTAPSAVFLAPNPHEIINPSISRSAKKRRAEVLDSAIENRKKPRRTMSALPPPLTLLSKSAVNSRRPSFTIREDSVDRVSRRSVKPELRSPSPGPFTVPRRPSLASLRRGATIAGPSLHRDASVLSERPASSQSLIPRPKTPALVKPKTEWGEIETRNRDSLNRVIVIVMKEHGLRDYRKERAKSVLLGEVDDKENGAIIRVAGNAEDEKEREDYKMVFHHTVKAAAFALRDVIEKQTVDVGRMRSVVERLVSVFSEGSVVRQKENKDFARVDLRKQLEGLADGFDDDEEAGGVILPDTAGDVFVV